MKLVLRVEKLLELILRPFRTALARFSSSSDSLFNYLVDRSFVHVLKKACWLDNVKKSSRLELGPDKAEGSLHRNQIAGSQRDTTTTELQIHHDRHDRLIFTGN